MSWIRDMMLHNSYANIHTTSACPLHTRQQQCPGVPVRRHCPLHDASIGSSASLLQLGEMEKLAEQQLGGVSV